MSDVDCAAGGSAGLIHLSSRRLLVMILGIFMIWFEMPTDIFPEINIPVISVAFNYTGMSPSDMEARIITPYERILTTTVNDIKNIESQSLNGIGVVKIYFQENAKIEQAIAQVTAVSQTAIRQMPAGTQPPLLIQYNAADVPIIQLSLSSDTIPEPQLFDLAVNQLRPQLITIPGLQSGPILTAASSGTISWIWIRRSFTRTAFRRRTACPMRSMRRT